MQWRQRRKFCAILTRSQRQIPSFSLPFPGPRVWLVGTVPKCLPWLSRMVHSCLQKLKWCNHSFYFTVRQAESIPIPISAWQREHWKFSSSITNRQQCQYNWNQPARKGKSLRRKKRALKTAGMRWRWNHTYLMKLFVAPESTDNYRFNPEQIGFQESPFSTSADSKIYYLSLKIYVSGDKSLKLK